MVLPMANLMGWGQKDPRVNLSLGLSATGWCVKTTNKYCNVWIDWLIDVFDVVFIPDLCTEVWEECCLLYLGTVSSWALLTYPAGCPSVLTPSAVINWSCCLSAFAHHQGARSERDDKKIRLLFYHLKWACLCASYSQDVPQSLSLRVRASGWVLAPTWWMSFGLSRQWTGKLPQASGLHFQCWKMATALSSLPRQGFLLWTW